MINMFFGILILISLTIITFTLYKYFKHPQRELYKSKQNGSYYYLDEPQNDKRNIKFVYRHCLFEGEKHLGATEKSFQIVTINVIVLDPIELKGITKNDLAFLEKQLHTHYPYAQINWLSPITQLSK